MTHRPLRVLHISDLHLDAPLGDVPASAWLGKRAVGGLNYLFRRRPHFRAVHQKVAALDRFRRQAMIDAVVCTGDYTVLGTDAELRAARAAIDPLTRAPSGFVTVPGNHDVYVPDAAGRFEHVFGDLLKSDLDCLQTDGPWPVVRLLGDSLAVIAINSARPNPQLWRSSGRIPTAQLEALSGALNHPRVQNRSVLIATHYAPRLADGRPDTFTHGLENADLLLGACARLPRAAILHGHVHRCYSVAVPGVRPRLFGAGSTTQDGREGLWVFDVSPERLVATRGSWAEDEYRLTDEQLVVPWGDDAP
jgi:3',5'-cyclic AMP phosphodiesterase CpdA